MHSERCIIPYLCDDVVSIQMVHAVLQGRENTTLDVQNPFRLILFRADRVYTSVLQHIDEIENLHYKTLKMCYFYLKLIHLKILKIKNTNLVGEVKRACLQFASKVHSVVTQSATGQGVQLLQGDARQLEKEQ